MIEKYAIIDIETTGGQAQRDRITEIAIVVHDGKTVLDTYETLLNPDRSIPYNITQITGIKDSMVADAPRFFEVAKKIVEMTKDCIFVAHNVRFDYGFIKEEFKRLGYTYVRKQLCTVRLSRKAFPGLRSYSLGNLISHFHIKVNDRHRAMADAAATAELFTMIMDKENANDQVQFFLNQGVKESKLPNNLTLDKLYELPELCGVYYLHNEAGEVVYVGKSINIQKRIFEHFADLTDKAAKMQRQVHDISYEVTGSELYALLFESHEIKRLKPSINKAQRAFHFPYGIRQFMSPNGFVCFQVVKNSVALRRKGEIIAEYPKLPDGKSYLKSMASKFELCHRYCHLDTGSGACFNFHIKKCYGACVEQENPDTYNERALEGAAALATNFQNDFVIIDKGRNAEEKTVVLVENGKMQGFGYMDIDMLQGGLDAIRDAIKHYPHYPETAKIIRQYLHQYPNTKVLVMKESIN